MEYEDVFSPPSENLPAKFRNDEFFYHSTELPTDRQTFSFIIIDWQTYINTEKHGYCKGLFKVTTEIDTGLRCTVKKKYLTV